MAELYSQYASGTQLTAGTIVGSSSGISGLNPIVDRLNSIATSDNHVTGSLISGTSTVIGASNVMSPYQNSNSWTGSFVSGTNMTIYASGGNLLNKNLNVGSIWDTTTYGIPDSPTDVGGSVVINTSGGIVFVTANANFILSGASNASAIGDFQISRDGATAVSPNYEISRQLGTNGVEYALVSLTWFDTVAAGAHNYRMRVDGPSTSFVGSVADIMINAVELRS